MDKQEKYRGFIFDVHQQWGPNIERYVFLGIGLFLSWPIFIPALILHAKVSGLHKSDYDLVSFYLPIFIVQAVLSIVSMGFINLDFITYLIGLNFFLYMITNVIIIVDVYNMFFEIEKKSISLISFPEEKIKRKTVKGYTISGGPL